MKIFMAGLIDLFDGSGFVDQKLVQFLPDRLKHVPARNAVGIFAPRQATNSVSCLDRPDAAIELSDRGVIAPQEVEISFFQNAGDFIGISRFKGEAGLKIFYERISAAGSNR